MSLSMHAMTVGQFVPMLKNLGKILEKAEAYAAAKKVEAGVIEGLRLAPDMLSFTARSSWPATSPRTASHASPVSRRRSTRTTRRPSRN